MSFRSRWQLLSALRPGGGRPQWPRNSFRSSRRWQHWQRGGGGGQATAGAGASAPRANVNACTHGEGTRRVGCCAPTARTRAYASLRKTRRARPARTVCSGAPVPMRSHCAIWCGSPRCARRGACGAPAGRRACHCHETQISGRTARALQRSRQQGCGLGATRMVHFAHLPHERPPLAQRGRRPRRRRQQQAAQETLWGRQAGRCTRPQPRATHSLTLSRTHCTRGCSSGVAPRLANAVHSLCTSRPPSSRTDRRNPFLSYSTSSKK